MPVRKEKWTWKIKVPINLDGTIYGPGEEESLPKDINTSLMENFFVLGHVGKYIEGQEIVMYKKGTTYNSEQLDKFVEKDPASMMYYLKADGANMAPETLTAIHGRLCSFTVPPVEVIEYITNILSLRGIDIK